MKKFFCLTLLSAISISLNGFEPVGTIQNQESYNLVKQIDGLHNEILQFINTNEESLQKFINKAGAINFNIVIPTRFSGLEEKELNQTMVEVKIKELIDISHAFSTLDNDVSRLKIYFDSLIKEFGSARKVIQDQISMYNKTLEKIKEKNRISKMKKITENKNTLE